MLWKCYGNVMEMLWRVLGAPGGVGRGERERDGFFAKKCIFLAESLEM
jgi:hypothetical protein